MRVNRTTATRITAAVLPAALAVTLVPALAKSAAHVTMLQRSPTYVVSRPAEDALANRSECGPKIDRCGGLADAPLLVGDRDDTSSLGTWKLSTRYLV